MSICCPALRAPRFVGCPSCHYGAGTSQPRGIHLVSHSSKDFRQRNELPSSKFLGSARSYYPQARKVHHAASITVSKIARCSLKSEPQVLETWSMAETYDALARRLFEAVGTLDPRAKYIVGLAGPPGAGKTTVAKEVVARLNTLWREERSLPNGTTEIAVTVPMDGFHLYRWQLDAMEDPDEAHARRGAPWTFDPTGLVDCLSNLRKKGCISLPSFDHSVGDPVEDDIDVEDGHRVVVVEGNYVLLSEGVWSGLEVIFDERWFVAIDLDEAMNRVEKRHVLTGKPPDVAKWRVAYNDRPNAELIQESRWNADLLIKSIAIGEVPA